MSASTRLPAVVGTFYPAGARRLEGEVRRALAEARFDPTLRPKALVAPHAGYLYSGAVAASAFATLAAARSTIHRVVLLGPSHFVRFDGLALATASRFWTPLGDVPVEPGLAERLVDLPQVVIDDRPHAREHSLEVELPFLQVALDRFELVPLVCGDASDDEVARVLERLWGGEETLIVVSTDLSHYLTWEAATRCDRRTADAILALAPERIGASDACGAVPLRGLLAAARTRGLTATELDLRNSGDTAGGRERVVGYGAFALA